MILYLLYVLANRDTELVLEAADECMDNLKMILDGDKDYLKELTSSVINILLKNLHKDEDSFASSNEVR